MDIYCCGCKDDVNATLTNGAEIYAHRADLKDLPFWKCENCGNFVGCHHKTNNPTKPLGNIPTKELRNARQHIHKILDPIWENKIMSRGQVYAALAKRLGYQYHTAEIKTVDEARKVYSIIKEMKGG